MEGCETIVFGNSEYDCAGCFYDPSMDVLYITLANVTVGEAAQIFGDSTKTSTITHNSDTFSGYTDLRMLTVHPYGIQATLKRSNA